MHPSINRRCIRDTVRALDKILIDYGIPHTSEIYEGDHVNRIEARLETKVLPFFAASLNFAAKKRQDLKVKRLSRRVQLDFGRLFYGRVIGGTREILSSGRAVREA